MKEMISSLERHIKRNELVNVEKTKILMFAGGKKKERMANKIICMLWRIDKIKFGHDFGRRMMMFHSLVNSMLMYRDEVRGWEEYEEKYIRCN